MNIFIPLVLIAIVIIIFRKYQNKLVFKDTTIIQLNNNNMNKLEKELKNNQPIVITNVLTKFESFETLCFDVLVNFNDNIKVIKKNELLGKDTYIINIDSFIDNIVNNDYVVYNDNDFFNIYTFQNITENINKIVNSYKTNYNINIFSLGTNTPILKNNDDKRFLFIYDGEIIVNLINPFNNNINAFEIIDNNKSLIVSISDDNKKTLNLVQIIGRTGKIIFIPKGWLYYYTTIKPNIVITATGNDFINQIFFFIGQ